jgi:hypothetical protein
MCTMWIYIFLCVSYYNMVFWLLSLCFQMFFFSRGMVDSTRGQKCRVKLNIQSRATFFDSWHGIDYKIASCKLFQYIHLSDGVTLYVFLWLFFWRFFFLMHPWATLTCYPSISMTFVCLLLIIFLCCYCRRVKWFDHTICNWSYQELQST